jgi:hypothetical protein
VARIIYTGIVSSINGSIGGTTFQRNAYGHTIKKKPSTVNPNRAKQQNSKGGFQFISQQWAQMTAVQRAAWVTYATTYPVQSRLNPNAYLTGHAQWLRTNLLREMASFSMITTITNSAQGAIVDAFNDLTNGGATLDLADDTDGTPGTWFGLYFLSHPVRASQLYDRSRVRFMGSLACGGVGTINLAAPYIATFGALPASGTFVFLKRVYINILNGQAYTYPPTNTPVT